MRCNICDQEFTTSGIYDCVLLFPFEAEEDCGVTASQEGLVHIHSIAMVDKRLITVRGFARYTFMHHYRRLRWKLWGRYRQEGITGWKFQSR